MRWIIDQWGKLRRKLRKKEIEDLMLDVYRKITWRAVHHLQKELGLNDVSYKEKRDVLDGDPRNLLFYGFVDEVAKTSYALQKIEGFLGENPKHWKEPEGELGAHIGRLVVESIFDELFLWQRKLFEILVDLINFKDVNQLEAYRAYQGIKLHDDYLRQSRDLKEFHEITRSDLQTKIDLSHGVVSDCLTKLPKDKAAFIDEKKLASRNYIATSMSSRFRKAMLNAKPEEKLVMGPTYNEVYGSRSASLHNSVGGLSVEVTKKRIITEMMRCYTLGFHIIRNIDELTGLPPSKAITEFQNLYAKSNSKKVFQDAMSKNYDVGDLVIVYGELGEITAVKTTKYGYKTFTVKCLTVLLENGEPTEDFPSQDVQRLCTITNVRQFMQKAFKRIGHEELIPTLMALPDSELMNSIKESSIEWRRKGLPLNLFPTEEDLDGEEE